MTTERRSPLAWLGALWRTALFRWQVRRLARERAVSERFGRRPRVIATACWDFPIEAQVPVYEELTSLIDSGFDVRFLYSKLNRTVRLPRYVERLWRARRRITFHSAISDDSYAYFAAKLPERVNLLVDLIARHAGLSRETVTGHVHFRQAFAFARLAEAFQPAYIHSYYFYEGSLYALVSSYLLGIPRGVTTYDDHRLNDYALKLVALHLRQSAVVVVPSESVRQELGHMSPATFSTTFVKASVANPPLAERVRGLVASNSSGTAYRSPEELSTRPMVSVIIIFLDAGRFITEAIDSVLLQTYARWELLLVDDGSSDDSTAIARTFAAIAPGQIRYVEHADHRSCGMSTSRNAGVDAASGWLIAFLDADDIWAPGKLQEQVAAFDAHPEIGMACGAAEYWRSWEHGPEGPKSDEIPDLGIEADQVFHPPSLSLALYPLGFATAPRPSDLMIRRDFYRELGGFDQTFRDERQLYDDQVFLAKMYLEHAVYISRRTWIRHRIHENSSVSVVSGSGKYEAVRLQFLDWLEGYLARPGRSHPKVARALHAARRRTLGAPETDRRVEFGELRRVTPT